MATWMPLGEGHIEGPEPADLTAMDRPIAKRRPDLRVWLPVAGIGCVLGILGIFAIGHGIGRTLSVGAAKLTVSTVRYGTFREYVPITGNVAPRETVYLDAVDGGQVQAVTAEAGETVSAGQPLLRLKNSDLQLQVIMTEAQLAEQINNLNSTRLAIQQNRLGHKRTIIDLTYKIDDLTHKLRRDEALLPSGAAARAGVKDMKVHLAYLRKLKATEIDAQQADEKIQSEQVKQLNAAVARITADLSIVQDNLDNLEVKAPIAGQLTVFDPKVGQSLAKGERIGQIDEVHNFKVAAQVDEFYLGRVAVGQKASVAIDAKSYVLRVAKVYPDVNDRQFEVDLLFDGKPPSSIRRGQTLRMNLQIGTSTKALILANGPFLDDTGGKWAFVVEPGADVAVRRHISVGRRNPDTVEILSGLKRGERVITSSYDDLMKFDRINLRKSQS